LWLVVPLPLVILNVEVKHSNDGNDQYVPLIDISKNYLDELPANHHLKHLKHHEHDPFKNVAVVARQPPEQIAPAHPHVLSIRLLSLASPPGLLLLGSVAVDVVEQSAQVQQTLQVDLDVLAAHLRQLQDLGLQSVVFGVEHGLER